MSTLPLAAPSEDPVAVQDQRRSSLVISCVGTYILKRVSTMVMREDKTTGADLDWIESRLSGSA